jgi:multidrug efflux pump subunit AcrB
MDGPALGKILERIVKPALEKLRGAGEVESAGSGPPETVVEVDEVTGAAIGISIAAAASALASADIIAPAGSTEIGGSEAFILADGRYPRGEDIGDAYIASGVGTSVPLSSFARIETRERKPEALSRVDGMKAETIAVKAGGNANLSMLSRDIAKEIAILSAEHGLGFRVLYDVGAEVERSLRSTLSAAIQGALAVALAAAMLIGRTGRSASAAKARVVAVAAVPIVLIAAAAELTLAGLNLDQYSLSGLAVGLGASVDSVLLSAERLARSNSIEDGRYAMRRLAPSLISGMITTLIVLVPLAGLDFVADGMASVAAAIAAVNATALLFAVSIMPPLVLGGSRKRAPGSPGSGPAVRGKAATLIRLGNRILARNATLCARLPWIPLSVAAVLSVAGLAVIVSLPLSLEAGDADDAVYAHVEFEPGLAVDSVDARLAAYSASLAEQDGITSVYATARRGSGSVLASFDRRKTDRSGVAEAARNLVVQGGMVWIPEAGPDERAWEVSVFGDDDAECRRIATVAAEAVADLPFVEDVVLDFKEGPENVLLRPYRERSAALGVAFSRAADGIRRGVHGPVAYKRIGADGESDVRVTALRDGDIAGIGDAAAAMVRTASGYVRADALMAMSRVRDVQRIYRRDRRRVASFTIRASPLDPREAGRLVDAAVASIDRPAGYSIDFDRDAIESSDRLAGTGIAFVLAAALAYMATAAVSESFGAPLAVMSALPPSLAVPGLLLAFAGAPLAASSACAFVAVSGMTVNASVLTVEERRSYCATRGSGSASAYDLYRITRNRFGALVATSATSVAGALPFLFLSESAVGRSLAFVAATGSATSFFVALTVIPALASAVPGLFDSFMLSDHHAKEGSR